MENFQLIFEQISLWLIPAIILIVLVVGVIKKVPVYSGFIEGAKDGAKTGIGIFPYLLAIIVAISALRTSGIIDSVAIHCGAMLTKLNIPVDTIPIMIVRSLSGSATLGILNDIAVNNDINSFVTKLSAVMVGSSESTFYVLAVYFGSVGITKYRHALLAGVLADIIGIILAITISSVFFL